MGMCLLWILFRLGPAGLNRQYHCPDGPVHICFIICHTGRPHFHGSLIRMMPTEGFILGYTYPDEGSMRTLLHTLATRLNVILD